MVLQPAPARHRRMHGADAWLLIVRVTALCNDFHPETRQQGSSGLAVRLYSLYRSVIFQVGGGSYRNCTPRGSISAASGDSFSRSRVRGDWREGNRPLRPAHSRVAPRGTVQPSGRPMSSTLNTVLDRLRAFGNDKLSELDGRCAEHRGWLQSAVEEVARQIAELGPATKKQRLEGSAATAARATAGEQVGASVPACCS